MRPIYALLGCLAGCSNAVDASGGGSTTGTAGTTGGGSASATTTNADDATLPAGTTAESGPTTGGPSTGLAETGPGDTTSEPASTSGESTAATSTGTTDEPSTGAPTGGCGLDPGPEGPQDRMLTVDGADRHYIVVVPPGYDPNTPTPVVFAWHGLGGDGALARLYFGIEQAAAGAAIFVYPDGLPLTDMGNQTGWDLMPDSKDVQFFDAMWADVTASLCVDEARVFSAGHSFGGYMSNTIGCYRGGVIRAIAPVAGGGPFWPCSGTVAAWIAHGTLDEVVPFDQGVDSRDFWTARNNCDVAQSEPVDPAPCVAYAGCDAEYPVHWCEHSEPDLLGHGWPGWAGEGIWAFFSGF